MASCRHSIYQLACILLGLAVSGLVTSFNVATTDCDDDFNDVASRTVVADIVIDAVTTSILPDVNATSLPNNNTQNVSTTRITFRVNEVIKGQSLVGDVDVLYLSAGGADCKRSSGVVVGLTYIAFLNNSTRPSADLEGGVYWALGAPQPLSTRALRTVREFSCRQCGT
jgi:hypothetical protein